MRIIPRSEWGARYLPIWGPAPQPASELWLHHSVTIAPDLLPPYGDDYAAVRTLERIGQERFGGGISYTLVFTPAGLVFEGHPIELLGSHTRNHNGAGRGLCLIGDYSVTRPTDAMLDAVSWAIRYGYERRWWTVRRLTGGHRDSQPPGYTECPGDAAEALIPEINRRVVSGPVEEDDVTPEQCEAAVRKVLGFEPGKNLERPYGQVDGNEDLYGTLLGQLQRQHNQLGAIEGRLDRLEAAVLDRPA